MPGILSRIAFTWPEVRDDNRVRSRRALLARGGGLLAAITLVGCGGGEGAPEPGTFDPEAIKKKAAESDNPAVQKASARFGAGAGDAGNTSGKAKGKAR